LSGRRELLMTKIPKIVMPIKKDGFISLELMNTIALKQGVKVAPGTIKNLKNLKKKSGLR